MSQSPDNSFTNGLETTGKKRKINHNTALAIEMSGQPETSSHGSPAHVPKRGARACTACRRGKNRCEGEAPCKRCQVQGALCVFEKPEKKSAQSLSNGGLERLTRLEGQYVILQSHMIGMQSALDRILQAIQTNPNLAMPPTIYPPPSMAEGAAAQQNRQGFEGSATAGPSDRNRMFPPMPGFNPAAHKFGNFGMPSTTASSEDETDEARAASLNAPIEALQGLANAAVEAAAAPSSDAPRVVKKRKRNEPNAKTAFPHAVEKGLVTDSEARELFNIFFAGCHLFIPIFDPSYDTYESLMERSPWTFNAILTVAAKVRSDNGPLSPTFYKCLEDTQAVARSSLFGVVMRKEAVQGMLLLAAWSSNGWIESGHAMRMALHLGLHLALEKLADASAQRSRNEEEERHLIVSARIWLCLYWFDHQLSLGTGRPIVLRDENTVRHCRLLLSHPLTSPTDVRLVSLVELIAHKTQIYEVLAPLNGQFSPNSLAIVRRAYEALDEWWSSCDEIYKHTMDQDALLRKILAGELHYTKMWLVCVSLRGVVWDKMPFEQRELAFQAKDAAKHVLSIFLTSLEYRAALRFALQDTFATAAFPALLLLKMAHLYPTELDLGVISNQVDQLAQLFHDAAAERYATTLRIMLSNLRKKIGLQPGMMNPPPSMPPQFADNDMVSSSFQNPAMVPFSMSDSGFSDKRINNPAAIPLWIQEQGLTDIGFPLNGSDGVFVNTPDFMAMPETR